uniref:Filament-like plant protein 3 n=1 Tax=Cajanus cajan TaxID=3821 RepID=A0A151RSY3_CAJCA|nr:Filament-like plant protein 3 [Cajanus cajan]
MDKKRWLWKRKSSEKSSGETESSGSVSSHSERYSDEQEPLKESPSRSNQSPDVTSKATAYAEDVNHNVKEGDLNDGLKNMSEKISAALVNVNVKEVLVQQHSKVAEEAIAGWEKAKNEVAVLRKQLDTVILKNSVLEDRVTHLDGALKECVRQLRQTREEQEENIYDAIAKKTQELVSTKIKLENKLTELQNKLDASEARSCIEFDLCEKVECLEKENMALRYEIIVKSEELEIRTIERDLSTQTAETTSKQHLESIKKVAKLEAECRRLRSMASRASLDHKTIAQKTPSSSVKIDLMDDFLEMERLVALPETKNESFVQESVVSNQCINKEDSLRAEFEIMNQQMDELKEKLEKVEADKAELEIALMKSEECIEESQLQLREAKEKLEEFQRELEFAYESKQRVENHLMDIVTEAQTLSVKVKYLEAEVDKERAVSSEIAMKYREQEEELERKSVKVDILEAELDKKKDESNEIAIKCKNLEKELERKSTKIDLLEADVAKEKDVSDKIAKKCKDMEEELESKSIKVGLLESEVDKEKAVLDEIAKKCKNLEEELESKSVKVELLEAEVGKEKAVSDEISKNCKDLEEKLESKSAKVDLLEEEVHKEMATSEEIAMKCRELEEELLKSTASSYGEKKIKQEDLALAARKLVECQKTIASLGNQLKSLATLEDFLIDTSIIPASPSLVGQASGDMWKLHSNGTYSPKRDSTTSRLADGSSCPPFFNKNEETSQLSLTSSTSSTALPNHGSSERSRNGFAKFFSRTKSGIRLEI